MRRPDYTGATKPPQAQLLLHNYLAPFGQADQRVYEQIAV